MKTQAGLIGRRAHGVWGAWLIWAAPTMAQWSNDPSQNLQVARFGITPQIASDGKGGAVIVWDTLYPLRVYAQRLDRYGYKKWGNWIRLEGQWDEQGGPVPASDGEGGAVIPYGDESQVVLDSTVGLTKCLSAKGNFRER